MLRGFYGLGFLLLAAVYVLAAQFEERPATLIALAFSGGIVLSALLPTRHSGHRSRDSASHDEKRGDSRNNFEALAGALASLAVASVARVIDSVTGPAYR